MKPKQSWISLLLHFADGQRGKLLLSVLLSVISVVAGLGPYYCLYRVLALFISGQAAPRAVVSWCAAAILFYLGKALFFSLSTALSHHTAFHVLAGLRRQITDSLLHAPMGTVQRLSIGQIKNILVDKSENIEPPLAHMVPEGAGHLVLPLISLAALCCIDWRLALAGLVTLPGALLCMGLTFKISGENFRKYNESNAFMNSTIVEYVEGIEVIKAFGKTGVSYEKYAGAIEDFRRFVLKWMASTWVTMKLAFALFPSTLLGTLPVSLALVSAGTITSAQACLAVMLSMSMVTSLARLEVFSESIRQMQETVEELAGFLQMERLPESAEPVRPERFDVALRDVHFSYTQDGPEVLHGVDLTLPQGSFTALVGPSGSGKSTIARLIARFWDVTGGSITVGGTDLRQIPLEQLTDCISFVAQDNFLFRCSILENIRLGRPDATDEEVRQAARRAQCEEFISQLPQGYETRPAKQAAVSPAAKNSASPLPG